MTPFCTEHVNLLSLTALNTRTLLRYHTHSLVFHLEHACGVLGIIIQLESQALLLNGAKLSLGKTLGLIWHRRGALSRGASSSNTERGRNTGPPPLMSLCSTFVMHANSDQSSTIKLGRLSLVQRGGSLCREQCTAPQETTGVLVFLWLNVTCCLCGDIRAMSYQDAQLKLLFYVCQGWRFMGEE